MNSCKIFIITLFCFFSITKAKGQDTLNSASVEQRTYQLYIDKNWSELIKYGNIAVHKGYDYFYLQLRIGTAYYEKKNYCLAEGHFKNALKFDESDELTQEYLYFCYVFTGRNEDARLMSRKFSSSLSEKIGTNTQSSVGFVMLEGGTKITDSANYYNKVKNGKPNYFNPPTYLQFGLSHFINNKVSLFHALTYFSQETFVNKVKQYQYYVKAAIPLKHNFLLSPSFQYIKLNLTSDFTTYKTDTLWPPGIPPHSQPPPGAPPFKTTTRASSFTTNTQSNYFVGSLAIQKIMNKFTVSIGTTVSNMSNVTQYIHSGFVSYSVLGNSKLVLGCTGYLHTSNSYSTTNTALAPFIYIQPINHLSLKLSYLYNTKNNIIEDNGYLVNNSADLTKSRYSVLLNVAINKHIALYGLYQLEYKHEAVQSFDYRYNVVVAGLKIIP